MHRQPSDKRPGQRDCYLNQINHNLYAQFEACFPEDHQNILLQTLDGDIYSYADAIDESARYARCLSDLGLHAGDRVTVQVEKSPEAIWLYLACLRGGFVFHPLNIDYQLDELVYFVSNAEPSVIICDSRKEALFRELTTDKHCEVMTLDADGTGQLRDATQETAPDDFDTHQSKANATAVLLYSSGTTGVPKGAMLTHGNLAANTRTLVESWGFSSDDCLLHTLPVYHAHGLFVGIGCVMMSGSSMIFLPRFNRDDVIAALPDCTVMMGVPTFYSRLLTDPRFDTGLCANMRLFISGSAPLRPETFAEFSKRSGHEILERYGMTETSMNSSNPLHGERRPGSVGLPLPGVQLRVVDDAGQELSAGTIGHLQVQGPNVFPGYWRMREKSAAEFTQDGFFRTGDEAVIDSEGYISIVGRAKDLIITGGLNVYPREIETVLDGLNDVEESAVIGTPHPDFGEGVIAVVVANNGDPVSGSALIAQLRPHMATYKLPKQVYIIDSLPRNSMGKVQKNLLRDRYSRTFEPA
jgi:malonyl-CoA/methylmalonyl-CoA synthetase